jgi:beta-galactosidase/beta-glucuronidase
MALQTYAQLATLDLSGTWRFQTDPMGFGMTPGSELYLSRSAETMSLPGTMDEGGKGLPNAARYVDRLSRKFEYCGAAWYQRELTVPEAWKGKQLVLNLERCHWETTVYVDGKRIGAEERLSTPHRFNLTEALTPGLHTLTVCVDNRLKYPMDQWNHGTTEYTQTNWNGMVGDLKIEVYDPARITALRTYPDLQQRAVRLKIDLDNATGKARKGRLQLELSEKGGQKTVATAAHEVELGKGQQTWNGTLALGKEMKLWDEFSPFLYEIKATLTTDSTTDERTVRFGMREVERGAHHVRLNGRDIHLRGALDCCVFPRTGYPAMQPDEWRRIFSTIKEYGMNHVRFHSWCPPEAAFEAADEVGIYLQAELPMWIKDVGKYPARRDFFEKELYAVLEEYGNHPSFLLMCNGNENEGDFAVLEDLVQKGQRHDNRHLYSASTARTHVKSDEFYVSHVSPKGGITVYEGIPSTDWDKDATSDIDCPVIAHETGQRCMYPNFKEMSKYTGVLQPRNFEVFRERLTRNGMLHQADDFFRATGAHTVLQYKEVNESLLRTRKSGGFQLLGLSDFPGQGSAYVGILDAFWESKGLVTPEKFRESCAPTVLLARMPKRTYNKQ